MPVESERCPISMRVVERVAHAKGVDFTELPPLYEAIDTDALDTLFLPRAPGAAGDGPCVEFSYAGFEVVVRSPRDIDVRRPAVERQSSLSD